MLVTGGAGFIGSHLVDSLLAEGVQVSVLDNFDPFYAPAAKQQNIAHHQGYPGFSLLAVDIRDGAAVAEAMQSLRPEAVVHLAAKAGVRPSVEDPAAYVHTNVTGTLNVLQAARAAGVARLVFGSSSSVYGNNDKVPFAEEDACLRPASPYAATKVAGEALCASFSECYGLPVVALRFFTVFGPRQRPDLAIRKFARLITSGQTVPILGMGDAERDYTYISDIVDGIQRALSYDSFPNARLPYRVFNLGSDRPVQLLELVKTMGEVFGCRPNLEFRPKQTGDVQRTWADLTRSRRELAYAPAVSLHEGLGRFRQWLEDYQTPH